MGVPVALKGHQHVCPLPKHVGGPIKEGHPGLTVNGIPVALVGHKCECKTGGPDIIAVGNPIVNGQWHPCGGYGITDRTRGCCNSGRSGAHHRLRTAWWKRNIGT
jgi:hypothetical protein